MNKTYLCKVPHFPLSKEKMLDDRQLSARLASEEARSVKFSFGRYTNPELNAG